MLLYIYILFLLYNFVLVSVVQQSVLQNCTVNPVIIIYIYISLHSWASFSPPNPRQILSPFLVMSLLWGLGCNRNGFPARVGEQGDEGQQGNRIPLLTGKWKVACSRVPFAFFSLWQIRPVTVLHHTLCFYASSWSQPRTGLRALPRSGAPLGLWPKQTAPTGRCASN